MMRRMELADLPDILEASFTVRKGVMVGEGIGGGRVPGRMRNARFRKVTMAGFRHHAGKFPKPYQVAPRLAPLVSRGRMAATVHERGLGFHR
jgi:hypothetical protein